MQCGYLSSMGDGEHRKQCLKQHFAMDISRKWIFEKLNIVNVCNIAKNGILEYLV
jgi:hypothetical protein